VNIITNHQTPRPVYVVRRGVRAHNHERFVAAELTTAGDPREYNTAVEAHAAAKRMGGTEKGFRVIEEWRTTAGMPCAAPTLES
jgi:hypothetical protein